jgi:uncharacterized membrane protein YvbJ
MALIQCPECEKEISDKVKACPHCGFPFENNSSTPSQKVEVTDIKINSTKIKSIITGIVVTIVVAFVIFIVVKNISKSTYISNLKIIHEKIFQSAVLTEELTTLTHDVWSNAIREKSDPITDKYTKFQSGQYKGQFYADFNGALRTLNIDSEIMDKKRKIRSDKDEIDILMKSLINPPKGYENCYNDLDKYYSAYSSLVDAAVSPSGSLTTYTSKINDADSTIVEYYKKIKVYF